LVCGGAAKTKKKYGHSYLRMLGSHLWQGPKYGKEDILSRLSNRQKAAVYFIDTFKYFYRTLVFAGILFWLINPNKIRE